MTITAPYDIRPRLGGTSPLDRVSLADAFEAACLVRCTQAGSGRSTPGPAEGSWPAAAHIESGGPRPGWTDVTGLSAGTPTEFSTAAAASRLAELLTRLGARTRSETVTAGGRRRYQLHRLHIEEPVRSAAVLYAGWRQGRAAMLDTAVIGASAPLHLRRAALAAAAWRAALLAAGRHVRTHILGIRLGDAELAAVLVRGAHLLGVSASVARRSGCLLVTVPGGVEKDLIMRHAAVAWLAPAD